MALRHTFRRIHIPNLCNATPSIYHHKFRCCSSLTTADPSSSKDMMYVNPTNALDGYEIVNSKKKPTIPALGFGTWGCDHFNNELIAQSVDHALRIGYRHLDCARVHANEKQIGAVIKDHLEKGTCSREELFVTSKLFNNEHAPPDGAPLRALETTLKDLGVDYLDSFLIHWPFRNSIHHPPVAYNGETLFFTFKLLRELEVQGISSTAS